MSQVLDAMFEKICTEGEHIIDQDDDGDNFYVIERYIYTSFGITKGENIKEAPLYLLFSLIISFFIQWDIQHFREG